MYTIVILAEQAMSPHDAAEVVSLHEDIEEPRQYHVLIPCDDARERVQTALSTLAASEVLASPPSVSSNPDAEEAQRQIDQQANDAVQLSVHALRGEEVRATGECTTDDPIEALEKLVAAKQAAEVIVMTRPHVVAELFHVDWTSKARRHLGVPILHLLEHEPLDAEAGYGQGITGM